ncbi:PH domain-containing protein [Flavobacterium oncorhynchi]|uniref:PH domain-containing protein n=1 Tax=Flavobacterium oncorhynchi TaxID=728056 RepID=UPI00351A6AE7
MKNSVKSVIQSNGNITYYLPSILFNNKKPIAGIFNFFLIIIIFSNSSSYHSDDKFLFSNFLGVLYLLSPRILVLKEDGIQYYSFWKTKWENIKDFDWKKDVLSIQTLNDKVYVVNGIDSNVYNEIVDVMNKKINVAGK